MSVCENSCITPNIGGRHNGIKKLCFYAVRY